MRTMKGKQQCGAEKPVAATQLLSLLFIEQIKLFRTRIGNFLAYDVSSAVLYGSQNSK